MFGLSTFGIKRRSERDRRSEREREIEKIKQGNNERDKERESVYDKR